MKFVSSRNLLAALIVSAFACGRAGAAIFDVEPNSADTNDGGAPYSLRDAILAANASPGEDQINLPAGTYFLSLGPADPSGTGPGVFVPETGDLDISEAVSIVGAGAVLTIIDGDLLDRVFDVHGVKLSLSGATVRRGFAMGAALPNEGAGALLRATDSTGAAAGGAELGLLNCVFSGNFSDVNGGAVGARSAAGLAKNSLAAVGCLFEQNVAAYGGGAIALIGATGVIANCEFRMNAAQGTPGTGFGGGAISSNVGLAGTLQITGSIFEGNTANLGGGLSHHAGALQIEQANFRSNVAVRHGGAVARSAVSVASTMSIFSSNFFANSGGLSAVVPEDQGGAIWNFSASEISSAQISFSRLFGNTGGVGEEVFSSGAGAVTIAENNWWGHDAFPTEPGEIGSADGAPPIDADPVLLLTFSAPAQVSAGGSAAVFADLNQNSDGAAPGGGVNFIPDSAPIDDWTETAGECTGPANFMFGAAEGLFIAGFTVGPAEAGVMVDEQIATAPIEIVGSTLPLEILEQPASQTVDPGEDAEFSAVVSGDPPFQFQWYRNSIPLPGEENSTLMFTGAQEPDEGAYFCRVMDQDETAFSEAAHLTVNDPAAILASPPSQAVNCGSIVLFHVQASGTAPLAYQWLKDNVEIGGATTETLTITAAAEEDQSGYVCRVSNALATKFSDDAELVVFGCGGDPREPNGAEFVSADLPVVLQADSTGFGFIRVRNTSNLSWSGYQGFNLALLQNDQNMANWPGGFPRLFINDPLLVIPGPGGEHVFAFSIHAPSATGFYNLEFQMVEENVEFFGPTLARMIEVRNSVADWALYE